MIQTLIGANAHPPRGVDPGLVLDLGAKIVRFPPWGDDQLPPWESAFDFAPFIAAVQAGGCEVLLVLDDVVHHWRKPDQAWANLYEQVRDAFPGVGRYQIRNEPDGTGDSSGAQAPDMISENLRAARFGLGSDVKLYAPGMIGSGNPGGADFLALVDLSPVDFVCVHQYGWKPTAGWDLPFGPLAEGLERYRAFGKPIAITEYGGEYGLFNGEHERARWFNETLGELDRLGVVEADVYCLTSAQCPDRSIVDEAGQKLESWAAIRGAAKPGPTPPPDPDPNPDPSPGPDLERRVAKIEGFLGSEFKRWSA